MNLDFSRTMWFFSASVIIITRLMVYMKLAYFQIVSEPDNLTNSILVPAFNHFPLIGNLGSEKSLWTMVFSSMSNACPCLQSIIAQVYRSSPPVHSYTFMLPMICNKQELKNKFLSGIQQQAWSWARQHKCKLTSIFSLLEGGSNQRNREKLLKSSKPHSLTS